MIVFFSRLKKQIIQKRLCAPCLEKDRVLHIYGLHQRRRNLTVVNSWVQNLCYIYDQVMLSTANNRSCVPVPTFTS